MMIDVPERFNGVSSEAGEASVEHEADQRHHLLLVGTDSQVTLDTQV